MSDDRKRLEAIARRAMVDYGLEPEWPPQAAAELAQMHDAPTSGLRDLRQLPWSSIDNDESRDLDQLEVCIGDRPDRLLVAIADVDALVHKGSAIDAHARTNTTSVYTAARIFPMLPEQLSTDRTSLNPGEDRAAIVVDMTLDADGAVTAADVYRALVHNHAKLAYDAVAAWLDGGAPPPALSGHSEIAAQVQIQDRLAARLRGRRQEHGALDFDRREIKPVMDGDKVTGIRPEASNRARDLIEDFMVAANGATAGFLAARGSASIRRVVRAPERWPRIVALAAEHSVTLPAEPNAMALEQFLRASQASDPEGFPELSLSVLKLLGRGEYAAQPASGGPAQHFALAVSNYTHSTAPNRRFCDLVTERLLKAAMAGAPAPYDMAELTALAEHCTHQEDAANKVERRVRKSAAALWLADRIGQQFDSVVTGASEKGTWVRLCGSGVEGKLERGTEGLDVGDRLRVRLVRTDAEKGFIDFVRAGNGPSGHGCPDDARV